MVLIRKLFVSVIVVFLDNAQSTTNQSFALIIVTDVAIVLGIYAKPFRSNIAQSFETLSLSVIHITLMAGLLLDADVSTTISLEAQTVKSKIITWVTLALNFVVIFSISGAFVWDFLKEQNLSELLQNNFIYTKIQAARGQLPKVFGEPETSQLREVMSLADFKQRSGGVILFQKKRSNRSTESVSTLSTASSKASSADIEKGNFHGKSRAIHRVPTIEEEIVFDLVLDAPAVSSMTNIYSDSQFWGAERTPLVDFRNVPKLDLTGIESDSSVSSAEAQYMPRFESEISLPILQSVIPMDSTVADTLPRIQHMNLLSLVDKKPDLVPQKFEVCESPIDTSESQSRSYDSEFSDRSSLEGIDVTAFQFEGPVFGTLPLTMEALVPSEQLRQSPESKAPPKEFPH